jgi:hypothetical protein
VTLHYVQELYTSRNNNSNGLTRLGELGRIWYDPNTNTLRVGDGSTPGGIVITGNGSSFTYPTVLSAYTNDVGYITQTTMPQNISFFNNDSAYITSASIPHNVSAFYNDAAYLTTSTLPHNLSYYTNDTNYITAASIPVNVSYFINDSGYLTAATLPRNLSGYNNDVGFLYANAQLSNQNLYTNSSVVFSNLTVGNVANLGNLYISDETIGGLVSNRDITLAPLGTGLVSLPGIKIPVGSIVQGTAPITVTIANLTLNQVLDYSTSSSDNLNIGDYGITNGISGAGTGWSVYQMTTNPAPALQVGDHITGTGVPYLSNVLAIGTGANANVVITNQTLNNLSIPSNGTTIFTTRDVVNAGFNITTPANTDVTFVPGTGGSTITSSSILPFTDDVYDLGSPAKRWRHVWVGAGTIYILDETLGTDQTIGAKDGNLYIGGGTGLTVGKFTLFGNTIAITNPSEDVQFGTGAATGNVNFNRPITVTSNVAFPYKTFTVSKEGLTTINPSRQFTTQESALSIIGSSTGTEQPRNLGGTMLQITGLDNTAARVSIDSFGSSTSVYPVIAGRSARGNVTVPTATQYGDTLLRLSAQGYGTTGYISAIARVSLEATQNFSDSAAGTRVAFYATPTNSTTIQQPAAVYANGFVLNGGGTGITFADGSFQSSAFNSTSAVTSLTAGAGIYVTGSTGAVTVDSTGILGVNGTANQINVTNVGNVVTLSLPQSINTNSSVTFANITVGNLTVLGNTYSVQPATTVGTILYLGNTANTTSAINGGGIILGNIASGISKSITYSQTSDTWVVDGGSTGITTGNIFVSNINATTGYFTGQMHLGDAFLGYDYPNSTLQLDSNINAYSQVVHQNHYKGGSASTDFVAENDVGTDGTNYIDMGINSSVYNDPNYSIGGANVGYLYVNGGNLTLGTQTVGTSIVFHVGNTLIANRVGWVDSNTWHMNSVTATALYANTKYLVEDTNQFFTTARARSSISAAGSINYNSSNGAVWYNEPTLVSTFTNDSNYATVAQLQANVNAANSAINAANAYASTSWYANAAYQENEIAALNANINAANAAIVAANSYNSSGWVANAAYQEAEIALLNANVTAANATILNVNASVTAANAAIITANNAVTSAWQANATIQENEISGLRANINAANTNISAANAAIINANIAVTAAWTANAAYQETEIAAVQAGLTAANAATATSLNNIIVNWNANAATQENEIAALRANITAANSAIVTANSAVTSAWQANTASIINAWTANASYQENEISSLNANIAAANAAIIAANAYNSSGWIANAAYQEGEIANLNANITAANSAIAAANSYAATNWLANAAYQENEISGLRANINAANSSLGTQINNVITAWNANASYQEGEISSINANLIAMNSAISSKTVYSNANVAGYMPVYGGNISAGNIQMVANSTIYYAAGTNTYAPANYASGALQSNSNLATGDIEYDGTSLYFTPLGKQRGIVPAIQTYIANANVGLTNQTSLQSMFALGNGVVVSSSTRYIYRIMAIVYKTNTGSQAAVTYGLGGSFQGQSNATLQHHTYVVNPACGTSQQSLNQAYQMSNYLLANFQSPVTISPQSGFSAQYYNLIIDGDIDVTTGGYINPLIGFTATPGSSSYVQAGAFMQIWPVGSITGNTSVGTWA